MFTPPSRAALPVLTDDDPKPHAGTTLPIVASAITYRRERGV
jgi:hypothetical protein